MKNSRSLITVAILSALASVSSHAGPPPPVKPTTVFLVRHASTVPETKATPDRFLSKVGKARAQVLRRLLGKAGVTHVFSSDYPRTRGTVGPLAKSSGVKIAFLSPRRPKQYVEAIQGLPPGSIAVVAGHSNTLPELIKALGGSITDLTSRGWLEDTSHDRLFMMTLGKGMAVQTVELRYGEASKSGPANRR
jgi:phosphohistidine phosphatase SixA